MADILVVDDDQGICAAFQEFLTKEGHAARIASNAQDAIASIEARPPDLVMMDIRMPGTDGIQALARIREIAPDVSVIMMTGYGTSQTSIEAMRLGAWDYLTKPIDLDVVKSVVAKALEAQAAARAARQAGGDDEGRAPDLVGASAPMQEAYKLIGRASANEAPVLLGGERGTGKRLVARTIHLNHRRSEAPFVTVDCSALPEASLAEELFGRAPTATDPEASGRVDAARGGTLFLADVHALSLGLQARLLGLLAERRFERPGAHTGVDADVRVIAGTDEDLAEEVRQGNFNAELFDALRLVTIQLPPLRDRRGDIAELVAHIVRRANADLGKTITGVEPRALELLGDHPWPGNVAELELVIKRAAILARADVITVDDVEPVLEGRPVPGRAETDAALGNAVRKALQQRLAEKAPRGAWPPFHEIVGRAEKVLVAEALAVTGGNQLRAAALLGLNRTTLRKKMRLYHL